ncbi:hypothetical protein HMPREF3192_00600 [Atopobium deltae]|uniref:Uncharacterized protein n=1 Tax=Atopobium deltae TaxID=1393034 RepID=A0A133XVM1_9ACTN|nr:hypothetical protein HMPREF3192_00600 [Atopobium deltae]
MVHQCLRKILLDIAHKTAATVGGIVQILLDFFVTVKNTILTP